MVALAGINLLVRPLRFRIDLTDDQRYSLSEPTKNLLRSLDEPLEVTLLLQGKMNASFLNLKDAAVHMSDEMGVYGKVKTVLPNQDKVNELAERLKLTPVVIHERAKDGQTVQTRLYPYAVLRYGEKTRVVPLLVNERGRSGEENVNSSIEQLEFAFAEAVSAMRRTETHRDAEDCFSGGSRRVGRRTCAGCGTAIGQLFPGGSWRFVRRRRPVGRLQRRGDC